MSAAAGSSPPLPPGVRKKMVSLAASALSAIPPDQVPPALRKAAEFAPARRARLAGAQLAAAVESDEVFRSHLGVHVRAMRPVLVTAIEEGTPIASAQAVEAAAAAYIVRPAGWEDVVQAAHAVQRANGSSSGEPTEAVDRLTVALTRARDEAKAVRERLGSQLEKTKADNAQLRRTLGTVRQQLRGAVRTAEDAEESAREARQAAASAAGAAEAEARRLRSRITDLEAQLAGSRRVSRDSRSIEAMRLRLLLDTVVEATSGLRRELALPLSDLMPADTVTAVEPSSATPTDKVGRGLLDDDPSLLRRLLELPRLHLIVDGYNVSKSAWPGTPLDQQRTRLISKVASLVAGKRVEVTVVFDGAELLGPPNAVAPRGIRVLFSPPGVIADDVIRELVSSEPPGRPVTVVSSDRELAESVAASGARSLASSALIGVLDH